MAIDWSILSRAPDAGAAFQQAYANGQERGRLAARDRVLANYAASPTPDALASLAAVDPQTFVALSRHERDRSDFAREGRGRAAYAGYLRQHEGALAGRRDRFGQTQSMTVPVSPTQFLQRPMEMPQMTMSTAGTPNALAPSPAPNALDPNAEIVVTGRPRVAPPTPMQRYSLADVAMESPDMADRLSGHIATIDKAHYDGLAQYFGAIGAVATKARELPATDRASFINANRDYLRMYGITDAEIDDFDDGDASLDGLIRLAMGVKDTLANAREDRRFVWNQADDRIDNARDDRRVAITDRSARDASARGWSADRRAERRYQRGDGANLGALSTDDLLNMLGSN